MTAVSAWIVDPQGRPVPGVDVLLTAQGWRGQRWAARSDARGRATFELPPMNARSAGTLTASVPSLGVERSGRLGEVLLVTVAGAARPQLPARTMDRAPSATIAPPGADALMSVARAVDPTGRTAAQLAEALRSASPEAVAVATEWLGHILSAPNAPSAGGG